MSKTPLTQADFGAPTHTSPDLATALPELATNTVHVLGMETTHHVDPFELWDEAQLAETLHTSLRTVQRWRTNGTGPAYLRHTRKPMYRAVVVLRWLEEHESAAS